MSGPRSGNRFGERLGERLGKGLVVLALLTTTGTAAAAMRCGNELISPGDSVLKLLNACGEPAYGDPALYLGTAQWTYNFGPNEFMQRVYIQDGKVERINQLGYGFKAPAEQTAPQPSAAPQGTPAP